MLRSVLLAALLPTTAIAACPTAADLETGIFVRFSNGSSSIYHASAAGEVTEYEYDRENTLISKFVLEGGFLGTRNVALGSGKKVLDESRVSYDFPLDSVVPLQPDTQVEGVMTETYEGGNPYVSRYQLKVGDERKVNIGGCDFTAMRASIVYDLDVGDVAEQLYLSDLGISLSVGYTSGGLTTEFLPLMIKGVR